MKRLFAIVMIISVVLLFCACNGNANDNTTPGNATEGSTEANPNSQENVTIDWETPIDVDDSFLNETSSNEDPSEGTEPSDTNPTTGSENDPTEPTEGITEDPTEGAEPSPTETTKHDGSRPIELPMIPG